MKIKDDLLLNFEGFLKTRNLGNENLLPQIDNFNFTTSELDSVQLPEMAPNVLLGKRAERFFTAWIESSKEYELVLENIQVFDDHQTLGEFDFIVRRQSDNQLIHIELIYKFYLFDERITGTADEKWIGPNRKDNLGLKRSKLIEKQFPLLHSPAGIDRLAEFDLNTEDLLQQVAFLGNLFVRENEPLDSSLNPLAVEGYWYSPEEYVKLSREGDQYCIPEKRNWFMRSPGKTNWLEWDAFEIELTSRLKANRSPMVWKLTEEGTFERAFIVWW